MHLLHDIQSKIFHRCSGLGLSVFGTIASGPSAPMSAYSIDDGDAQAFTAVPPVGVEYIFQQLLFNHSGLSGEVLHTLSVSTMATATYFVDYIEVQAAPTITTTLVLAGSITTSTTTWTEMPSGNTRAVAYSASGSSSATMASTNFVDYTRTTSTAPIVGGALGGVIVLLLIIALILFLRWRRSRAVQLHVASFAEMGQ